MMHRIRLLIISLVLIVAVAGFYYIRSVIDSTPPELSLVGIENEGSYAGDMPCVVTGKDNYKVRDLAIWLDDKLLINPHSINRKRFEYPFSIPTQALSQGKHVVKVIVCDGSRNANEAAKSVTFFVDNTPLQAAFVKVDGDLRVFQGRTLHMQFQTNKPLKESYVETLAQRFPCIQESNNSLIYECFIPIKCEEPAHEHLLRVVMTDKVNNQAVLENKFHVVMYPFKKQNLVVSSEKTKEEAERGLPEGQLEVKLQEITSQSPTQKLWHGAFYIPIEMRGITTDFGTLRTTQERGKYRHNALDLIGNPRTVVWADQDGIIVLKDRYAHSGNTVIIDHGCGVLSLFYHLDSIANINVGDTIRKGQPVGTLGKTGYASGYHLHWEIRVNNIQVDPMQWTQHGF